MVILSGSNYEQSLLHILENMVPEAVSDAEMILHTMLQRNQEMGWQKKVDSRLTYTLKNGLG